MSQTSGNYRQLTLWDTDSATFSAAYSVGPMLSSLQDGQATSKHGQDHAHVNHSQQQVNEKGLPTIGTCGQTGSSSSKSADLQLSLANKLRARMPCPGLILYSTTWKERVTPAGRRICALRASGHRTSGKGFIGWPTPQVMDSASGGQPRELRYKGNAPSEKENTRNPESPGSYRGDLKDWAALAGWGTPLAQHPGGTPEAFLERKRQAIANGASMGVTISDLAMQVQSYLAGWSTPQTSDHVEGSRTKSESNQKCLGRDMNQFVKDLNQACRITTSGEMLIGSTAEMESSGPLNPEHSRWLMGYPREWGYCGAMGMQLLRKSRRNS